MLLNGITTLFTDIGGVLLTNGWDHHARQRAAHQFGLDFAEMDDRHHLTFDTYEEGKHGLDEYLNRVIFYTDRPFRPAAFKRFMMAQSQPYPEMLDFVRALKTHSRLKIVAVSNEGRELTTYRVRTFSLTDFIDVFVVSSFVHLRKPDRDIYRMALDMAQVEPEAVLYLEDRPLTSRPRRLSWSTAAASTQ